MSQMHIALPETVRKYVESRAREARYTPSDYICSLIRHDRMARRKQNGNALKHLIAIGIAQLDRGEGRELDMEAIIRRAERKSAKPRKSCPRA